MRKSFVALLAAGALVATGPVLAQSRAADMLGIHRATLRKKLREYGLA